MLIDKITVACKLCREVRAFRPVPKIRDKLQLHVFLERDVGACPKCGHIEAEIKARDLEPDGPPS